MAGSSSSSASASAGSSTSESAATRPPSPRRAAAVFSARARRIVRPPASSSAVAIVGGAVAAAAAAATAVLAVPSADRTTETTATTASSPGVAVGPALPPPRRSSRVCRCERGAASSSSSSPSSSSPFPSFADPQQRRRPPPPPNPVVAAAPSSPSSVVAVGRGRPPRKRESLRRRRTLRRMDTTASRRRLSDLYVVDYDRPLGEGSYGAVYPCVDRHTSERLALKKIDKECTTDDDFLREMNALLLISSRGGHPNICMMRKHFDEDDSYSLVLDLVDGKELFEHLIDHGAYSEADAARLVGQVASALDYLHGIGVVHADMKPENLMLERTSDAADAGDTSVKLVDFGCAEVRDDADDDDDNDNVPDDGSAKRSGGTAETSTTTPIRPGASGGTTPAYCPPEAFDDEPCSVSPSVDMWGLGVILYIMLTGLHPFDLECNLTSEQMEERIRTQRSPPLHDSPHTAHLSPSAIDLLSKLMDPNPSDRLTAHEMLSHPWVTGRTANRDVMAGSDVRLSKFRRYQSKIEARVFADLVHWSHDERRVEPSEKGSSLMRRAFMKLNRGKGILTTEDLDRLVDDENDDAAEDDATEDDATGESDGGGGPPSSGTSLSFSGFSDMIGENIKSRYFPRGHIVYHEGDTGDYMYFINSGTVEVSTADGFRAKLGQGDSFGTGGVQGKPRSATIKCATPVHALQVGKECFDNYVKSSQADLAHKMREKINRMGFGRALFLLSQHSNLKDVRLERGEVVFEEGDEADALYLVESGQIDVRANGHTVYSLESGDVFGLQSFLMDRSRRASAVCVGGGGDDDETGEGCQLRSMNKRDFHDLLDTVPNMKDILREFTLRREFQRAIVLKLKKSFPTASELREAFDEIDLDRSGALDHGEVRELLKHLDKSLSEEETAELVRSLDLDGSGRIDFEEFKSIFG